MTLRLTTLATLALALSACDSQSGLGPELAPGPILPVAEGNAWAYESATSPDFELRVGEPAEVDGADYFRLEITEGGRASDEDEYVRAVGGGAELLYRASIGGEVVYREETVYRYPVDEGTYVVGRRSYTVARERVTVPAGTFEVVTYSGYDGDPSVSASFAPGVGIVRFFDGSDDRVLTDYDVR